MLARHLLALAGIAAAAGLAAWLLAAAPRALELHASETVHPPRALGAFELIDHRGRAFTRESLRGSWTLVFIGFTHCPDICPDTLWRLAQIDRLLESPDARPQILFVSVDPERDTPEVLARYAGYFGPHITGATGTPRMLAGFTAGLGLGYVKVPLAGDAYTVEHSAAVVLVDPQARVAAYVRPPVDPAGLAADLDRIHVPWETGSGRFTRQFPQWR